MFEENEVLTLILGVITLVVFLPVANKIRIRGMIWLQMAVTFLVCTYLCTNLEVLCIPNILNFLEHLFTFFAAVCGTLAAWQMCHRQESKR